MQCRDVRELADSFLAEELLTETNHDMLRHIESCPVCRTEIDGRRRLREALRTAVGRAPDLAPRPEFMAKLQADLRNASGIAVARRRTALRRWLALAATVVLAVAVGFLYRARVGGNELARTAVGDHQNCAVQFRLTEKPISLEDAARRYGEMYRIADHLPPTDIVMTAGTARVLERHACVYGGRRFAHVVLRYGGKLVSVMVTAADTRHTAIVAPSVIDGMNVTSFMAGHQVVFVAGDISTTDLQTLTDAIAAPLIHELAAI
jgi:hypothetical protein